MSTPAAAQRPVPANDAVTLARELRHKTTILDDLPGGAPAASGLTVWRSEDGTTTVYWAWKLDDRGKPALADPLAIRSNLAFHLPGQPPGDPDCQLLSINRLVHALHWEPVVERFLAGTAVTSEPCEAAAEAVDRGAAGLRATGAQLIVNMPGWVTLSYVTPPFGDQPGGRRVTRDFSCPPAGGRVFEIMPDGSERVVCRGFATHGAELASFPELLEDVVRQEFMASVAHPAARRTSSS